ncbi:MAG TPA: hypothetical protein VGI95_16715 [Caulobacteraceae bacterium]|jgi:hypothetical protein
MLQLALVRTMDANGDTVFAVFVGAILATAGGFFAGQVENTLRRRERERGAALLFGEILSTLSVIVRIADEARSRGDPYGRVTMRTLKAAQRETHTYDRNRETLFDLRDPFVRAGVHSLIVRLSLALEGALEADDALIALQHAGLVADASAGEPDPRLQVYIRDRETAFEYAIELRGEIPPLLARLGRIARHSFDALEAVSGDYLGINPPWVDPS